MRREVKSLRIGVHHANAVAWGPVYRTHLARVRVTLDELGDHPRTLPGLDRRVERRRFVARAELRDAGFVRLREAIEAVEHRRGRAGAVAAVLGVDAEHQHQRRVSLDV